MAFSRLLVHDVWNRFIISKWSVLTYLTYFFVIIDFLIIYLVIHSTDMKDIIFVLKKSKTQWGRQGKMKENPTLRLNSSSEHVDGEDREGGSKGTMDAGEGSWGI